MVDKQVKDKRVKIDHLKGGRATVSYAMVGRAIGDRAMVGRAMGDRTLRERVSSLHRKVRTDPDIRKRKAMRSKKLGTLTERDLKKRCTI